MKNFESTKVAKEEFESMIDYLEVENEKPVDIGEVSDGYHTCLLYTSPSPRD